MKLSDTCIGNAWQHDDSDSTLTQRTADLSRSSSRRDGLGVLSGWLSVRITVSQCRIYPLAIVAICGGSAKRAGAQGDADSEGKADREQGKDQSAQRGHETFPLTQA